MCVDGVVTIDDFTAAMEVFAASLGPTSPLGPTAMRAKSTSPVPGATASDANLDLSRAPYVLYGVKYIDLVSLAPFPSPTRPTPVRQSPILTSPPTFFKTACKQFFGFES